MADSISALGRCIWEPGQKSKVAVLQFTRSRAGVKIEIGVSNSRRFACGGAIWGLIMHGSGGVGLRKIRDGRPTYSLAQTS